MRRIATFFLPAIKLFEPPAAAWIKADEGEEGMETFFSQPQVNTTGLLSLITGQSDLAIVSTPAGLRVASVTGAQGGIMFRDPTSLLETGSRLFGPISGRVSEGQLEPLTLGGRPALAVFGLDAGVRLTWLDQSNPLGAETRLAFGGETLVTLASATLAAGRDVFFTTGLQSNGISAWIREADGSIGARIQVQLPAGTVTTAGSQIRDLAIVQHGGTQFLLATSAQDNSLAAWRIEANGQATLTAHMGNGSGLAITTPHLLRSVNLGGQSYILLGASGSSSVSVFELDGQGRLTPRDQVNDDLMTRFQGVTALETIVANGRAFVAVAGSDHGVTMMEMLEGGRLIHLASVAEGGEGPLLAPTGLALIAEGSRIEAFLSSAQSKGVIRLDLDTELITVHRDGASPSTLTGTAQADIFVMTAGGGADSIHRFEVGRDRLDLSDLGRLYSLDSLRMTQLSNGIELRFGDELIRVYSASGKPISASALSEWDLMGLWHVPINIPEPAQEPEPPRATPLPLPAARQLVLGGGADDFLFGGIKDPAFDAASSTVYRLYLATLAREPDKAGLIHWTDQLASGTTPLLRMASSFIGSPEFVRRYGSASDADFVTLLYRNVLGREPDPAGFSAWTSLLQTGSRSREQVVLGFSESGEFIRQTQTSSLPLSREGLAAAATAGVYRLYEATLDRQPDPAGLEGWSRALAQGRSLVSVAEGFLNSSEFARTYGNKTDSDFVTLLYQNVLGRSPDKASLATWVELLESGSRSRAQVILGFSESAEFTRTTKTALTDYMRRLGAAHELQGQGGTDLMQGSFGADRFVFDAIWGDSNTRIANYEPWDWIVLKRFGYDTPAEVMAHVTQQEKGLLLQDQNLTLYIHGASLADFQNSLILL